MQEIGEWYTTINMEHGPQLTPHKEESSERRKLESQLNTLILDQRTREAEIDAAWQDYFEKKEGLTPKECAQQLGAISSKMQRYSIGQDVKATMISELKELTATTHQEVPRDLTEAHPSAANDEDSEVRIPPEKKTA